MADGANSEISLERYRDLWRELKQRTVKPLEHPRFLIYFLLSTIFLGGLGFWLELVIYSKSGSEGTLDSLLTALISMFPAVAGAATLKSIWAGQKNELVPFSMLMLFLFAACGLLLGISDASACVIAVGVFVWAGSLWFWLVIHADEKDLLYEKPDPTAPIGGDDPKVELQGDLSGLQH